MALLAAMAGHLRGSVHGAGGHERGKRVRTTGVGSAGNGIIRVLSAQAAEVSPTWLRSWPGLSDDAMAAGA